ncbi:MAG TPA: threonine ammonia-lyase [Nitrospirota bacterium]|nr:threonine ammonia-lyase [Nitrospirota bacterium]
MININDIQRAGKVISAYIHKTPLIRSNALSALTGADVYLKLENLQKTGAFKVRGAFNKMIHVPGRRVVAASMGNHAQAVAFAAYQLGKKATIVMPTTVSLVKEEATRGYHADVILYGEGFKDALEHALQQKDAAFIHAFDDDEVIAGQGTIALEILEELENIDAVFVPVGGGGLVSGIATAVKALSPKTGVIGVQAEAAPAAQLSYQGGKIIEQLPLPTIADGIAVARLGEKTFELINNYVDEICLVSEGAIAKSILLFLERKKLVVEGAGAVTLAALMENRTSFANQRVVLVLSGGNIDFTIIDRIIRKGLVTSNRIGVFEVVLDDIAGSLHAVIDIIASLRANVLDILHDRLAPDLSIGKAKVVFTVEIRGKNHLAKIFDDLENKGYAVREKN